MRFRSTLTGPNTYFPKGFSEIYDWLGSMILHAPTFLDDSGWFDDRNIDTEFDGLLKGFGTVKAKLSDAQYGSLISLAERAKALFAADQDDTNGKTDEGRKLLFEVEDIIQDVRRGRVEAKLKDDEGEITGD